MKYVSKRRELRLIMTPTDRSIDDHRRVVIHKGKKAEFFDGRFETHDSELIEWMHNHPDRGRKFDEITPKEERGIAIALGKIPKEEQVMQEMIESKPKTYDKPNPVVRVVTGAVATDNAVGDPLAPMERKIPSIESMKSQEISDLSPALAKMVDEKIDRAIGQIIELLKPAIKQEERAVKIMEGKPTKIFKCPFCEEVFSSGFGVGKHKREKHSKETVLEGVK